MSKVKTHVWNSPEGWRFRVTVVNPGKSGMKPGDTWSGDGPYEEESEARANADAAAKEFPG